MARVRVGAETAEAIPARKVAPYVVGYALMSIASYEDPRYGVPDARDKASVAAKQEDQQAFGNLSLPWLAPWSLADAFINECRWTSGARRDFGFGGAKGDCASDESPKGRILDGLGVQVWTHGHRNSRFCREIVIAFRGTDRSQRDDWLSNFRFLTRVLPLYDQYEQVQDHIGKILDRIERYPCYRAGKTEIVAAGHSLGGGLAQQAAYKDNRIRRVFAFDPSFVTGYFDLKPAEREKGAKGLRIERVYEHGEILAYPRLILRNLYPPSACDPQIRHIRFDLIEGGSVVAQHSLPRLTTELLALAKGTAGAPDDDRFLPASSRAIGHTGACRPPDAPA